MKLFKRAKSESELLASDDGVRDIEPSVPDGMWLKCSNCGRSIYRLELGEFNQCPKCGSCFRLSAWERIGLIADEQTFMEMDGDLETHNPIDFPGYEKKIAKAQQMTGLTEAVVCGSCLINSRRTILCVMDSSFVMASMGTVVGEKITRAFEYATENRLPIVIFTASGGARMQEGMLSLMQMAKVSAAAGRHSDAGLLYITVLTDPTTGGVTASFAMLGDIILAEPRAVIGFAGRRVIEQTTKKKLPNEFQRAEFLLEHGFIDKIVSRRQLKKALAQILALHGIRKEVINDGKRL